MPSDSELLLRYARNRDEAAFAEVVRGHIDLVYSAALRRVGGDAHAAAEVTQEVFLALARHAERLARHPVLNAWLHTSTRNAAANLRRSAQRHERQKQLIQAMSASDSVSPSAASRDSLRVELDAALDDLGEPDRVAIILRFFENRSYPAIGEILGLREEAVRMRVGRALEKLRGGLQRRGISSTAVALGGALTAQAVSTAPAGLAASVSATVLASAAAPAVGAFAFMSTAKTTVAIAAAGLIAGVGVLVYRRPSPPPPVAVAAASTLGRSAPLSEEQRVAEVSRVVADTANRPAISPGAREAEDKIAALRDMLSSLPEQGIPELKLATEADWHAAVEGKLETADDYRLALAKIRRAAERRFATAVAPAVRAYARAHGQQFPADPLQLQPFVGDGIDTAMLRRYRVAPASEIPNVILDGDQIITQRELIDSEHDHHLVIGPDSFGATSSRNAPMTRAQRALEPVFEAYKAAGHTRMKEISDLKPYATTPEQHAAIELFIRLEGERRERRTRDQK